MWHVSDCRLMTIESFLSQLRKGERELCSIEIATALSEHGSYVTILADISELA